MPTFGEELLQQHNQKEPMQKGAVAKDCLLFSLFKSILNI
jgi:hypothetical protein